MTVEDGHPIGRRDAPSARAERGRGAQIGDRKRVFLGIHNIEFAQDRRDFIAGNGGGPRRAPTGR